MGDADIETYLRPLMRDRAAAGRISGTLPGGVRQQAHACDRRRLKALKAPALIVWGTDDVYFGVQWGRWLAKTLPGTKRLVELTGARIFFPEERWAEFNRELRGFWQGA